MKTNDKTLFHIQCRREIDPGRIAGPQERLITWCARAQDQSIPIGGPATRLPAHGFPLGEIKAHSFQGATPIAQDLGPREQLFRAHERRRPGETAGQFLQFSFLGRAEQVTILGEELIPSCQQGQVAGAARCKTSAQARQVLL